MCPNVPVFRPASSAFERLTIVLDKIKKPFVGKASDHIERRRIAENAHADDCAGPRSDRRRKLRCVEVNGFEFNIDDLQPQSILLQRMVGRRPGDCWDYDFIATQKRALFLVEQRGDGKKICGGT